MIEHLDNNEQILLMYLADELPPDDRAEVVQMLATDETLRSELERLRSTHQMVMERLGVLDAASPLPVNVAAAARQVGRDMRQWLARPSAHAKRAVVAHGPRSWGWALPAAAAAAIVVATGLWVSRHWPTTAESDRQQYVKSDDQSATGSDTSRSDEEPIVPQYPRTQAESSYTLLVDSFPAPPLLDEPEPVAVSSVSSQPEDGVPIDDLSQYLLRSDATQ